MNTLQVEDNSDEHKQAVLHRQLFGLSNINGKKPKLATYATNLDRVVLSLSSVCAIIAGALNPLVPVCLGYFPTDFSKTPYLLIIS